MSESGEAWIDEGHSVHLQSRLGTLSWKGVAGAWLPGATELVRRRYVEAITVYLGERERELSRITNKHRRMCSTLSLRVGHLKAAIDALMSDPSADRLVAGVSRLMRGNVPAAEISKALKDTDQKTGRKLLYSHEARRWKIKGPNLPNPLGELEVQLELLQRAAELLKRPPPKKLPKTRKAAQASLLERLYYGVWIHGSQFQDALETRSQFFKFMESVSDTLPTEKALGNAKAIEMLAGRNSLFRRGTFRPTTTLKRSASTR